MTEPVVKAPTIACSLTATDQEQQILDWRNLLSRATVERIGPKLTARFPAYLAGELCRLAVAEHECCPFISFEIVLEGKETTLTMTVPVEAEEILRGFARARQ